MALVREGIASFPFDFKSSAGTIWMDDCGGRDQVVSQVCNQGWRSYEPPLPLLIAKVVSARPTAFFDVGANTAYDQNGAVIQEDGVVFIPSVGGCSRLGPRVA